MSGLFNTTVGWPNLRSWQEASKNGCIGQYQTTPAHWSPLVTGRSMYRGGLKYVIGNESCVPENKYCNGPLKAGTEYTIIVRLFTGVGYSDSAQMFFRTDEMILIETIIISVTGCLVLSFILGLLIYLRKNMKNKLVEKQKRDFWFLMRTSSFQDAILATRRH
jgi:TM proximal of protein tyrosine phosphatase, receptor type J